MNTIKEIRFCPYCGTPVIYKPVFGKDRPTCPSCHWTHFEDPKVAVAALIEKDDKVLLTRRLYPPERGKWSLPAGFMDAHEDPISAVTRECLEETGLQIAVTGLIKIFSGREHPNGADILIAYSANVVGGVLKAGDDASGAEFFPRSKLPPLAFKSTFQLIN